MPKVILDLKHMKDDVTDPKALFHHILGLTKDYITTSEILRTKYGILCRIEPTK